MYLLACFPISNNVFTVRLSISPVHLLASRDVNWQTPSMQILRVHPNPPAPRVSKPEKLPSVLLHLLLYALIFVTPDNASGRAQKVELPPLPSTFSSGVVVKTL